MLCHVSHSVVLLRKRSAEKMMGKERSRIKWRRKKAPHTHAHQNEKRTAETIKITNADAAEVARVADEGSP